MYAYCQDMPGVSEEMVSRVEKEVGEVPVAGLIAHVSGPTGTGWRIIDVWESEADYQRFSIDRLNPALVVATRGQAPPSRPFESLAVTGADRLSRRG
jgi:hypothetical protein